MQVVQAGNGDIMLVRPSDDGIEVACIPADFLVWYKSNKVYEDASRQVQIALDSTWDALGAQLDNLVPMPSGIIGDDNANQVGTWRIYNGMLKLIVEVPMKNKRLDLLKT